MFTVMALVIGHYICDFPLQNDFMALNKVSGKYMWKTLLVAHCAIHMAPVLLITHSCELAIAEFFCHLVTDYLKGKGWISLGADQTIHLVCKLSWAALFLGGVV